MCNLRIESWTLKLDSIQNVRDISWKELPMLTLILLIEAYKFIQFLFRQQGAQLGFVKNHPTRHVDVDPDWVPVAAIIHSLQMGRVLTSWRIGVQGWPAAAALPAPGFQRFWNALSWWNLLPLAPSNLLRRRYAGAEPRSHIKIEGDTDYENGCIRARQQLDFGFPPHAPLHFHCAVRRKPLGHACVTEAWSFPESPLKRLQVDSRHGIVREQVTPPCIAGVDCWKIKFDFKLPFHDESDWPSAKLRFHHWPKGPPNVKLLLQQGHLESHAFFSRILILAPEALNVAPLEALVIWPIEVDGLAKEFEGRVRVLASHDSGKLIRVHQDVADWIKRRFVTW